MLLNQESLRHEVNVSDAIALIQSIHVKDLPLYRSLKSMQHLEMNNMCNPAQERRDVGDGALHGCSAGRAPTYSHVEPHPLVRQRPLPVDQSNRLG